MIVNLYVEIHRDSVKSEFERLAELESAIKKLGHPLFNATDYDSYTSGFCKLNTLEEIEEDIRS